MMTIFKRPSWELALKKWQVLIRNLASDVKEIFVYKGKRMGHFWHIKGDGGVMLKESEIHEEHFTSWGAHYMLHNFSIQIKITPWMHIWF